MSSPQRAGRIELICGCMFAGKTRELIERLTAAREAGQHVLAIKHALDTRYDPKALATHDGHTLPAVAVERAEAILPLAADVDVIGIDEAQFFRESLLPVVRQLKAQGKRVIVAGIDNDAWGRPFPPFPQLMPLADEVTVRTQPCTVCGRPARYSQRMTPVLDEFMVGGVNDYEPRCERCFEPLPESIPPR